MTAVATRPEHKVRLRSRFWLWTLVAVIGTPLLLAGAMWAYGPYWIAPVDDFVQGPGGAIAYISLGNQLRNQAPEFWGGEDVELVMNQAEFSGMLSSALLSGRQDSNPIRKVRASLSDSEIRVESVLMFEEEAIPERYRGPVGLKLGLRPMVTEGGLIEFRIARAAVGRIPVPPVLIRWSGKLYKVQAQGFNPAGPSVHLPLSDMVASLFGRNVRIRQFKADEGRLLLVVAMQPKDVE